jgi:hypothetical protein
MKKFVRVALATTIACAIGNANAAQFESKISDDVRGDYADALESPAAGGFTASQDVIPDNFEADRVIPYLGPEVLQLKIVENGVLVDKYWQALTPEQWALALQDAWSQVTLYKVTTSGGLTIMSAGSASLEKGKYRLTKDNFRYKNYPCSESDPGAGDLLVGVGLRIRADVESTKAGVKIGLPFLALEASRGKIKGTVDAQNIGLASYTTLDQVVKAATATVTFESLIAATVADSVAGQALENVVARTNPRIIGYIDKRGKGSCLAALNAGS